MPELPEVETIRQDLRSALLGKKIRSIDIKLERIIKSDLAEFQKTLPNNSFKEIDRTGKLLIFKLEKSDLFLLVHLKMTGQLVYISRDDTFAGGHSDKLSLDQANKKYSRVIINFSDKSALYFNDLRTFGLMRLVSKEELEHEKSKFGIEPLQENFQITSLKAIISKSRLPIKALLLDQKRIAGIGNIYADEILFASGVLPDRPADKLHPEEIEKIFKETKRIIKSAIENRGTTFNNYVDGKGQKGSFTKKLKVYGRAKQDCLVCKKILIKKKVAGRGTVFCSYCQK